MHTGQNSIAPENPLPQLGQVRWGSVFMVLTAVQPQPEPKATRHSTGWCKIGPAWLLAKLFSRAQGNRVFFYTSVSNHVSEQNSYRWCPAASRVYSDLQQRVWLEINSRKPSTFEAVA